MNKINLLIKLTSNSLSAQKVNENGNLEAIKINGEVSKPYDSVTDIDTTISFIKKDCFNIESFSEDSCVVILDFGAKEEILKSFSLSLKEVDDNNNLLIINPELSAVISSDVSGDLLTSLNQELQNLKAENSTLNGQVDDLSKKLKEQSDNNLKLTNELQKLRDSGAGYKVGDTVTFGKYYQSNDTDKEPIKWTVIASRGDAYLLISDRVLDKFDFGDQISDWENSDFRKWLNSDFIDQIFSDADKQKIVENLTDEYTLENDTNHSDSDLFKFSMSIAALENDTNHSDSDSNLSKTETIRVLDKIFCLNANEALVYFSENKSRKAYATWYAMSRGVSNNLGYAASWILSSNLLSGGILDINGQVQLKKATYIGIGVRPAVWVKL